MTTNPPSLPVVDTDWLGALFQPPTNPAITHAHLAVVRARHARWLADRHALDPYLDPLDCGDTP